MQLVLLRHAEAVPGHDLDADRPLTTRGLQQAQVMGQLLAARFDQVRLVASPWLRACQTAEQLSVALRASVSTLPELTPVGSPEGVAGALEPLWQDDGVLVVVTHQPLCGRLVNWLVDGRDLGLSVSPCCGALLELDWPAAGMALRSHWLSPNPD
ncbi:phosphohistidine phosphatase SixA [Marinobacterium stanieri]|uniref:phosphohistidine phosphatase SixA n=1 Tax=Marinobacterium stanieri TaxID=49186 RepID=UPI000255A0EB|nr:phosphohistidine phosphatase SixA [Marinobacterium stanieri]